MERQRKKYMHTFFPLPFLFGCNAFAGATSSIASRGALSLALPGFLLDRRCIGQLESNEEWRVEALRVKRADTSV